MQKQRYTVKWIGGSWTVVKPDGTQEKKFGATRKAKAAADVHAMKLNRKLWGN